MSTPAAKRGPPEAPSLFTDKPRIKLDPTRPGWGKWQCVSYRSPTWGGLHCRIGKGYSPAEAYRRWQRAVMPHGLPRSSLRAD